MAVEKVGVQIVAEGVQQAIQQANQFGAAVTGIGTSAQVAANSIKPLDVAVNSTADVLKLLQQTASSSSASILRMAENTKAGSESVSALFRNMQDTPALLQQLGTVAEQSGYKLNTTLRTLKDGSESLSVRLTPLPPILEEVAGAETDAAKAGEQLAKTTQALVPPVGQLPPKLKDTATTAEQAAKGMSAFNIAGIPVVITMGDLKNAAMGAIQPFINLGREAFGATAAYQRLAMSMESLVAKEIRSTDSTIEMTDALAMAKPRAAELLKWIQELAINSPFSQEGVAQAFRTAQAYGFTAAEAQRLTKATIDFSSATGASSYQMDIIALALGQIKAKGKLAGQEILQLTNAGLAINPILAKMGFTMADVSKGVVGADQFIKTFVETLESDFGGAAARTTGTLEGLTSTISDLKTVGLRELFMPFFEAVTPALSAFASGLNNLMPVITFAGETFGNMTKYLIENKEAVLSVIATIAAVVGSFLLISNYSLVAGLAVKGLTVVLGSTIGVLGAISTAVTFLLSPIGLLSIAVATLAGLFVASFGTMQDMMQSMAVSASKSTSLFNASLGSMSETASTVASSVFGSTKVIDGTFRDATTGIESSSKKMEESVTANFSAMGVNVSNEVQKSSTKVVSDWGEQGDKVAQIAAQQTEDSHSWGYNLVMQFANGMAQAIGAVLDVLTSLGEQIAYWLAPGSPPRITPDIDTWGEEAMGQFVKGFTKADFGQLQNLSGTIKGYLGSLGEDVLDQKDLIPTLLGSREAIAEAIAQIRETGSVGSDSIQKIIDSIGVASPELENYITSLLNVEQTNQAVTSAADAYALAQDKVRLAQESLNAVSEKYNAILAPMNAELEAIAEKRRQFTEGQRVATLQAIVNDKNAPAIAKELALMELREIQIQQQIRDTQAAQQAEEEAAQSAIDSAKEEADGAEIVLNTAIDAAKQAQEQIELQKEILDLQIEQNNLYKDLADSLKEVGDTGEDALDKVGDGAKGAAGKVADLTNAIGGLAGGISPIGNAMGGLFDGLKKNVETFVDDISKPFSGLQEKFAILQVTWARAFILIGSSLQTTWDTYLAPIFGDWSISLQDIGTLVLKAIGAWLVFKAVLSIGTAFDSAILLATRLGSAILSIGTYALSAVKAVGLFIAGISAPILILVALIAAVVGGLIYHFGGLDNTINAFSKNFETTGTFGSSGPMVQALNAMSKNIDDWVETTRESFTGWVDQVVASFALWLITTSEQITTWTTEKEAQFAVWATNVAAKIALWATNTLTTFNRWITDSLVKISMWVISFGSKIASFAVETIDKFTQFWDDSKILFDEKVALLLTTITDWKEDILERVTALKTSFVDKINSMWTDIKSGFDNSISSLLTKMSGLVVAIQEVFTNTDWSTLGLDIITGIVEGIIDNATSLYTALRDLIADAIADALAGLGGGGGDGPSPQGVANGFANTAGGVAGKQGVASMSTPNILSLPSLSAPPVTYNRSVTNHNQFTGIGNANVNNGMDVQNLQAIIEMTVVRVMRGQGYGS